MSEHDGPGDTLTEPAAAPVGSRDAKSYRYPGSPPFRDVAVDRLLFKGRSEESRTVLHSILSSDLFLFYAVSGMGKSSLLNAGVMHELRRRGYWPVSVRLNDPSVSPVDAIEQQIIDAAEADDNVDLVRTPGFEIDATSSASLWDMLGSIEVWRGSRLQHVVLILDQFEELFTLDWPDDVRTRFISEFGEVVRGYRSDTEREGGDSRTITMPPPDVKFVLVIREDALGELEALADDVPQLMQHRFRLGPLDPDQALAAVRDPAMEDHVALQTQKFTYTEDAANEVLSFLQHAERTSTSTISEARRARSTVDPSQLQIICQYIERRVLPTKDPAPDDQPAVIESSDLGGVDGLRSILGDFYRRTVASFPESDQPRIRDLCETGLISSSQRRLSLESGAIQEGFDVPIDVLDSLVDHRLLRADPRVGSVYYELAHDTLVQPILADRDERQRERSRRRRRLVATVLSAAAAIIALVAVIVIASSLVGDDAVDDADTASATASATTLPAAVDLRFDQPEQGEIEEPGASSEFRLVARPTPMQIVVEADSFSDLNPVIEVTNAAGARRTEDRLDRGRRQTIIVPSDVDGGELSAAVTSNDGSTGGFSITTTDVAVIPLQTSGSQQGEIAEPGANVVFAIDATETIALDVRPNVEGNTTTKGLDVIVQLIDPSGRGRQVDSAGPGDPESTTLDRADGQTLVVIRGYDTSIGSFEIITREVDRSVLAADDEKLDQSVASGEFVEYAIQVTSTGLAAIVTPATGFDPVLEVIGPDGQQQYIDSGPPGAAEVALLGTGGEHVLRVSEIDGAAGAFRIRLIASIPVALEQPANSATTPAAFEIAAGTEDLLILTATPDATEAFLSIDIPGPSGFPIAFGDSGPDGGPASVLIDGGLVQGGSLMVRVTSNLEQSGVTVNLASVESKPLDTGGSPTAATTPAAFDAAVDTDDVRVFTAQPEPDDIIDVQVTDPSGFAITAERSSTAGAPVSVAIGATNTFDGDVTVVVTSENAGTEIAASLTSIDAIALAVGDSPVAAAAPAAFEVTVGTGDLLEFTAEPDGPDDILAVQVIDPGGYPINSARSLTEGEPVTIDLGTFDGFAGESMVVVTSQNQDGGVTASLTAVEPVPLAVGGPPATEDATAVYQFDVPGGQLAVATVHGQSADGVLDVQSTSVESGFPVSAYSASPGVPVAILLDPVSGGSGRQQMIVRSTEAGDAVSATVDLVEPQPLTVGESSEVVRAPAVFDVIVEDGETLTLAAETDAADSFLAAEVYDSFGIPIGATSVFQPLPELAELPPEVVDLFSPEVREFFADGLPPTVDEAIAQLGEAGLLDEVVAVISENEIAADALLEGSAASTGPAQVSVDVGSGAPGRYRVVVSSVDRESAIRVSLSAD